MTNPAYEATNTDVEKVEKKKYPSDNYLNEILTNTEFAAVVPIEAVRCMARELMLLRTPHPNGMMQLSNELAEMKRKCAELEARSITVKWPDYVDGRTLGYGEVNHMIDLCVDAVELACHASGIRIKSED